MERMRSELSWTHYRLLMRVEDEKARTFYLNETAENGWSFSDGYVCEAV